jgi:uncharacterized protein
MSDESDDPQGLSPLAIAALIFVALPMVFSLSSSSTRTVNGVLVEASFFDPVAVVAGAVGLLCALLLGIMGRGARRGRWAMAVILMAVGARHVLHGLGVFSARAAPSPVATRPSAPECDPDSPQECAALCDQGDGDACDDLGVAYGLGQGGLERDVAKAEALFIKACGLKDPQGCFNAGVLFHDGDATTIDRAKAIELSKQGCSLKDARCCNFAGAFIANGTGVDADPAALPFFEKACEARSEYGCQNLGRAYRDGMLGVTVDVAKALGFFEKACELRQGDSCNDLAVLLDDEDRSADERARASAMFVKACELNSAMGCANLGHRLLKTDPIKAVDVLDQACLGQRGRACEELGVLLYQGAEGVEKNFVQARRVFARGCEAGHANSCTNEGILLADGEGGDVDLDSATEYFRKACDLENEKGCARLGTVLAATDPAAARPLLVKGCADKFSLACESLKKLGKPDKKKTGKKR